MESILDNSKLYYIMDSSNSLFYHCVHANSILAAAYKFTSANYDRIVNKQICNFKIYVDSFFYLYFFKIHKNMYKPYFVGKFSTLI